MKYNYPQTYYLMMKEIESNTIYDLSRFDPDQKENILRTFFSEVSPQRLDEINEDFIPELKLEVSFLYPDNKKLRSKAIDILWDKYRFELDKIFNEAESDNFKQIGGISDHEDWRNYDLSRRLQDSYYY